MRYPVDAAVVLLSVSSGMMLNPNLAKIDETKSGMLRGASEHRQSIC
jgi:hypothetical protein